MSATSYLNLVRCNTRCDIFNQKDTLLTSLFSFLFIGKIREWEFKPYCTNCYEKLPSEVRKKYEKKRDLEIRQEKQRQREAIKAERERIKKMAEKDKKK